MDEQGRQSTGGTAMTAERLRSVLDYDASTGVFRWRVALSNQGPAGSIAGTVYANGRRYITIARKRYFASRLAWLYVFGEWPSSQLDHKNLDRSDDRIANLRVATTGQNSANRRVLRSNRLGVKGVGISTPRVRKAQRYRARIRVDGRLKHLGYYATPELASRAYEAAARELFGEFARTA